MIVAVAGLRAQTEELMVRNGNKGSYVEHKVTAKENFYSIGRLFNVHPKYLAAYNSLDMSKGLGLGQSIRIPLTDTNFIQQGQQGLPVYYIAGEKESLAKVSNNNKKVVIENLRQWNHLSNDDVSKGQKLIVGFIVSNETKNTVLNIPKKNEQEVKTKPVEEKKAETVKIDTANKPEKTREEIRQEKIEDKKADIVEIKKEAKQDTKGPGYFKLSFDQQVRQQPLSKEQTVTSGIFKTTSGWTDAKYYLLMSGIEPGTIVRVTNPINSKMIYAKVLGEMNSPKQGLNIRISNAAAATLGVEETDKFIVRLNY
jgi:LysM repeat protein